MKKLIAKMAVVALVTTLSLMGLAPLTGTATATPPGPWLIKGQYTGTTDQEAYDHCFAAGIDLIIHNIRVYSEFACVRDAPRLYRLWAHLILK